MEKQDIFTKTAKGARALQDCKRLLPQNECRILSLVNGKFTLEDIQALLSTISAQAFLKSIELLMKEGYVRQLSNENDGQNGPATEVGVIELDTERGVREWAAATRAVDALTREGYYLTQEDKQPCNGPQQILIIDDEQAIGEVVSAMLSSTRYPLRVWGNLPGDWAGAAGSG